jgi:uncharacterized protein YndB with AHSA1/START domain
VRYTVHLAATPQKAYEAIIHPEKWWDSEHTFTNNSGNLSLDPRAGGCFCERGPDGVSIQHLVVVNTMPGKTLVLRGALGPFQGQGVDGALSWVLKPAGTETDLTVTYTLGGYLTLPGGFEAWAKAADGVIGSQVAHLQKFMSRPAN